MTFLEFLQLTKVIRMLYGKELAVVFFEKSIDKFYGLSKNELNESIKQVNKESEPIS